jgi:O-antigen/teichoic acid export membrane protein
MALANPNPSPSPSPSNDVSNVRWQLAVRGGFAGVGGRVLAMALAFVVTPIAITKAGNTTYGLFAAITAFATLLGFGDFGIGNGLIREVVRARAESDTERERVTIRSALILLTLFGVGVAVVGNAAAFGLPWRVLLHAPAGSDSTIRLAVASAAICVGFAIPGALCQKVYLARQQPSRANAWVNGGAALSSLALLVAVMAGHHLPFMVAAQLGAPAAAGLISLLWLDTGHALRLNLRRTPLAITLALLRNGRLFAILQVAAIVNFEIDNLVVARFLGPGDVTTFAASSRLLAVPIVLSSLFFTPLWAAFADAAAHRDTRWLLQAYKRSTVLALAALGPAALILAFTGASLIRAWTRGAVHSPGTLVLALSVWIVVYAVNQPQAMLLNGLHAERFQISAATANVALNLTLSIFLTIKVGISGPIWGTAIAQVLCAVIPTTIYLRQLTVRWASGPPDGAAPTTSGRP